MTLYKFIKQLKRRWFGDKILNKEVDIRFFPDNAKWLQKVKNIDFEDPAKEYINMINNHDNDLGSDDKVLPLNITFSDIYVGYRCDHNNDFITLYFETVFNGINPKYEQSQCSTLGKRNFNDEGKDCENDMVDSDDIACKEEMILNNGVTGYGTVGLDGNINKIVETGANNPINNNAVANNNNNGDRSYNMNKYIDFFKEKDYDRENTLDNSYMFDKIEKTNLSLLKGRAENSIDSH